NDIRVESPATQCHHLVARAQRLDASPNRLHDARALAPDRRLFLAKPTERDVHILGAEGTRSGSDDDLARPRGRCARGCEDERAWTPWLQLLDGIALLLRHAQRAHRATGARRRSMTNQSRGESLAVSQGDPVLVVGACKLSSERLRGLGGGRIE